MAPEMIASIAVIILASIILALAAASETALERASVARIQSLASRGDVRAQRIVGPVETPRELLGSLTTARVLSAAAIIIAFAYMGARTWGDGGAVGLGSAGALYLTALQMTVGILAARQPEFTAIQFSGVVTITDRIFGIPAFILGLPAWLLARTFHLVTPVQDDDILTLMEREAASGGVEEHEQRMIRGIIDLEDKSVREIMVPRIDIAACDIESSVLDVAAMATERGYSRLPVYRDSIDNIVGVAYAKDLLHTLFDNGREQPLDRFLRQPVFVPESKRLDELLTEMRSNRTHLAIVVDEYGGTAGVVTIEDLIEEIVGEIEDEYDVAEPTIEVISADEVLLDAGASTDVLKELFDYDIEAEEYDTVGGFLIHELGRLPAVGDELEANGLRLRVLSMAGRRVRRLRVARVPEEEPSNAASA